MTRACALALLFAVCLIVAISHFAYAGSNSGLACPVNPVPSFMDVVAGPPVGAGSEISVLVYNISPDDYIKNGITGGLVILVNQTNATNIQLMYDVTNSQGWANFSYDSDANGCTNYWFIFCPLTDAVNPGEAREMCLNGTKIPASIIGGTMPPEYPPSPNPTSHDCTNPSITSKTDCLCHGTGSGTTGFAPAQANPSPSTAFAVPQPSTSGGSPLTAAGFFSPSASSSEFCQEQAWLYDVCNKYTTQFESCAGIQGASSCNLLPACHWNASKWNASAGNCISWESLCENCKNATRTGSTYCSTMDPAVCKDDAADSGCTWSSNQCVPSDVCTGVTSLGTTPVSLCDSGKICCSDGTCASSCTAAPKLPSSLTTSCPLCLSANDICSGSGCALNCPWGKVQCPSNPNICVAITSPQDYSECCPVGKIYCPANSPGDANTCEPVCNCPNTQSLCPDGSCSSSCVTCGTLGLPCCPAAAGNPCNLQQTQPIFCNTTETPNVCRSCGGAGQVCCPSTSPSGQNPCTGNLNCMSGICTSCAPPNYLCSGACTTPVCQWTGDEITGSCGEISTAGNTPGYMAPLNPNTSYYLPSTNQFYICNQKPSTYTNLCWPVMLIVSLLIGASFLTGKNPFMAFDFSSPRMGRGKQYTMRNQNKSFDITAAVMVGADKASETASGGEQGLVSKALSSVAQGTVGKAAEAIFGKSNATKDPTETALSKNAPDANAKPVVPPPGDDVSGQVNKAKMVPGTQAARNLQTAADSKMGLAFGIPSLFGKLGDAVGKLGNIGSTDFEKGSQAEAMFKGSTNAYSGSASNVFSAAMKSLSGMFSGFISNITNIFSSMFNFSKRREGYDDDGKAKTGAWEWTKDAGAVAERFLKGVIDLYATFKGISDTVRQYKGLAKGLGLSHMSARESQRGIGFIENIDQKASGMTIFGREMSIGEMVRMVDVDPTSYAGPLSILLPAAETLHDKAELDSEAPSVVPLDSKKLTTKDGQKVYVTSDGHVFDKNGNELVGDKKKDVLNDDYVKLAVGEMRTGTSSGVKSEDAFLLVGADGKAVETDFMGYRQALINRAHHDDLVAKESKNSADANAAGFMRLDKLALPLLNVPLGIVEAPVALITGKPTSAMKEVRKLNAYGQSDEFAYSQLFVNLGHTYTVDEKSKGTVKGIIENASEDDIKKIQGAMGKQRSREEILEGLSKLENSDLDKYREFTRYGTGPAQQDLNTLISTRQAMVAVTESSLKVLSKGYADKDDHEALRYNQGAYLGLLYTEKQESHSLQNIMSGESGLGYYTQEVVKRSKAENEKHLADNKQLISDYEKAKELSKSDQEKKKLDDTTEALKLDNAILTGAIGATQQEKEGFLMANKFFLDCQQQVFDDYSSQAKWIATAWRSGEDTSKLTGLSNKLDKTIQNIDKIPGIKTSTLSEAMLAQRELSEQRESIFKSETSKIATKATVSGGLGSPALQKDGEMRAVSEEMGQKSDKLSDLAAERMTALVEGKASESADKKYALASQEFGAKYNEGGSAFERGNIDAAKYLLNQTKGNLTVTSGNKTFEVNLDKVDVGKDSDYKKNELAMNIVQTKQVDYLISKTDYSGSPLDVGTLQMNAKKAIAYADMRADELVNGSISSNKLDAAVGLLGGGSGWTSKLESQEMRVFDSSSAGVEMRLKMLGAQWEASHGPLGSDYLEDAYSNLVDQARGATETNKPYSLLYDTLFGAPGGYDQFQLEEFKLPLEQIEPPKMPEIKPTELPRVKIADIPVQKQEVLIDVYSGHIQENPYGPRSTASRIKDAKPSIPEETKKPFTPEEQRELLVDTAHMMGKQWNLDKNTVTALENSIKVNSDGHIVVDANCGADPNIVKAFVALAQSSGRRTEALTRKAFESYVKSQNYAEDMTAEQKAALLVQNPQELVTQMAAIPVNTGKRVVFMSSSNIKSTTNFFTSSFSDSSRQMDGGEETGKKKK